MLGTRGLWVAENTDCRGKSSAFIPWHEEEVLRGVRKSKGKRMLSLARGIWKTTLLIRSYTNQRDRSRQILDGLSKASDWLMAFQKSQHSATPLILHRILEFVHRFME